MDDVREPQLFVVRPLERDKCVQLARSNLVLLDLVLKRALMSRTKALAIARQQIDGLNRHQVQALRKTAIARLPWACCK